MGTIVDLSAAATAIVNNAADITQKVSKAYTYNTIRVQFRMADGRMLFAGNYQITATENPLTLADLQTLAENVMTAIKTGTPATFVNQQSTTDSEQAFEFYSYTDVTNVIITGINPNW